EALAGGALEAGADPAGRRLRGELPADQAAEARADRAVVCGDLVSRLDQARTLERGLRRARELLAKLAAGRDRERVADVARGALAGAREERSRLEQVGAPAARALPEQ